MYNHDRHRNGHDRPEWLHRREHRRKLCSAANHGAGDGRNHPWNNGNTTTITKPQLKSSKKLTVKCVAKYGAGTSEETGTAVVTSQVGTGDSPIPGVFKAKMCFDSAGNIHGLKPTKVT